MQNENIHQQNQQEMNLYYVIQTVKDWVLYFFKKWWLLLLIGIMGGGLGILYAYLQKAKYEARLTFAMQESKGGLSGALSLASEFGFNVGGGQDNVFSGDNIIEILKSRRIIERVLLSTDSLTGKTLANEFMEIQSRGVKSSAPVDPRLANISFPVNSDREKLTYLQDTVLFNIYKGISTTTLVVRKPDKKLNIYEITYQNADERFAQLFTQKLTQEATDLYLELKSKRALETLTILEDRVALMKSSMNRAITSKAEMQDRDVNPAYAIAAAQQQKKQVDVSVYGGAYGELFKNLELARYDYLSTLPVIEVLDQPYFPLKKIKQGRLRTGIIFAFVSVLLGCIFLAARRLVIQAGRRHKQMQSGIVSDQTSTTATIHLQ